MQHGGAYREGRHVEIPQSSFSASVFGTTLRRSRRGSAAGESVREPGICPAQHRGPERYGHPEVDRGEPVGRLDFGTRS